MHGSIYNFLKGNIVVVIMKLLSFIFSRSISGSRGLCPNAHVISSPILSFSFSVVFLSYFLPFSLHRGFSLLSRLTCGFHQGTWDRLSPLIYLLVNECVIFYIYYQHIAINFEFHILYMMLCNSIFSLIFVLNFDLTIELALQCLIYWQANLYFYYI